MIAFDTDVFTDFLYGEPSIVQLATGPSSREFVIPAIILEEILRGRLNLLRQAEARKAVISVVRAYLLLQQTIEAFQSISILSYSAEAEAQFHEWRRQRSEFRRTTCGSQRHAS